MFHLKKNSFLLTITPIIIILGAFFIINTLKIDNSNIVLNENNETEIDFFEKIRVMCTGNIFFVDQCLKKNVLNNEKKILWIGNSQLNTVNQFKIGERASPVILYSSLKKDKIDLTTFYYPNLSLLEYYILLSYLVNKNDFKIIILPLFFDDTREQEIRDDIKTFLFNKDLTGYLSQSSLGKKILSQNTGNKIYIKKKDIEQKSLQENFEKKIISFLNYEFNWTNKINFIEIRLNYLIYRLRNTIFGINPSTTRKLIPYSYNLNIEAFKEIIELSKKKNIKVFSYIPPIRNDTKIPYNLIEYENFIKNIKVILDHNELTLFNYENLIPNNYWGTMEATNLTKDQDIDFMHFQYSGHQILSKQIYNDLKKINDF